VVRSSSVKQWQCKENNRCGQNGHSYDKFKL
jgi:hypothetical protein